MNWMGLLLLCIPIYPTKVVSFSRELKQPKDWWLRGKIHGFPAKMIYKCWVSLTKGTLDAKHEPNGQVEGSQGSHFNSLASQVMKPTSSMQVKKKHRTMFVISGTTLIFSRAWLVWHFFPPGFGPAGTRAVPGPHLLFHPARCPELRCAGPSRSCWKGI